MQISDRPQVLNSLDNLARSAAVKRTTKETDVEVTVNLDGQGKCDVNTGIPFLEHMLHQIASHGLIDLDIKATGHKNVRIQQFCNSE